MAKVPSQQQTAGVLKTIEPPSRTHRPSASHAQRHIIAKALAEPWQIYGRANSTLECRFDLAWRLNAGAWNSSVAPPCHSRHEPALPNREKGSKIHVEPGTI
jgi:hypothetical protein